MKPTISLIMTVKNGMPFLAEALESVAQQQFKNFELLVQDGQSTDGSLEVFKRYAQDPRLCSQLKLVSERDASLADAKKRAFMRCSGEILGSIDADNLLEYDCLEWIAQTFRSNPKVAVIYGAQHMIDEHGEIHSQYYPAAFDIINHLECLLVPPFGSSFFRSSMVGDALIPSADLLYCADFELWLKLHHLLIANTPKILTRTRISKNSITCRPESYEQMCKDKVTAIERFFERFPNDSFFTSLRRRCEAGVYLWAAESVKFSFPAESNHLFFLNFIKSALELHPESPRALLLMQRAGIPT